MVRVVHSSPPREASLETTGTAICRMLSSSIRDREEMEDGTDPGFSSAVSRLCFRACCRYRAKENFRTVERPELVGNRSGPISLPSEEIERLRVAVASGLAEPHPYLKVGSRVRIMHGPLTGTEGILKRKHGSLKVVLSVEMIMKSVAVTVNSSDVEPCSAPLSVTRHSVYGMSA